MGKKTYTYSLWEVDRDYPDLKVAEVCGPDETRCMAEIGHYAIVYGQDGPVEMRGPSFKAKRGASQ